MREQDIAGHLDENADKQPGSHVHGEHVKPNEHNLHNELSVSLGVPRSSLEQEAEPAVRLEYHAPENALQINSQEPENRIRNYQFNLKHGEILNY